MLPAVRALAAYRRAIRRDLVQGGMEDLPRSASWLLGALVRGDRGPQELAARLGTSKQGLSRLVQTLVERGYASRAADPGDRRRVRLTLTERGEEAHSVVRRAVRSLDLRLAEEVGERELAGARGVLLALATMASPHSEPEPAAPA